MSFHYLTKNIFLYLFDPIFGLKESIQQALTYFITLSLTPLIELLSDAAALPLFGAQETLRSRPREKWLIVLSC